MCPGLRGGNPTRLTLTSIVCKLLEHVVYSSVINFLDDNDILSDFQHGFRQRRSCENETQLITSTLSVTFPTVLTGLAKY